MLAGAALACAAGSQEATPVPFRSRAEAIPSEAGKRLPADDLFPPVLHNNSWQEPVPLTGPVNTAGAEDSPFITPDGRTLFFFFTPDASVPAQEQLFDGATGIWWTHYAGGAWEEPERVALGDEVSLDGCPFFMDDVLWFCTARASNTRDIEFYTARWSGDGWEPVENAGELLNVEYGIGEMHLSADGSTLLFHWTEEGGYGGIDIWQVTRTAEGWSAPVNLGPTINTAADEGWPYLSPDGQELWFTGTSRLGYPGPALFRSIRTESGEWGPAEEIASQFAGEPTLDAAGNLYFIHHFMSAEFEIIEADIYVAYRQP
jgi:hypothetical protein